MLGSTISIMFVNNQLDAQYFSTDVFVLLVFALQNFMFC